MFLTHSPAKIRIRSSSSDRKKRLLPGSPCRPQRPRNCKSMRRASCRSVPMMCRPPSARTSSPSGFIFSRSSISLDQRGPFLLRHVEPRGVFVLQQGPGHRLGIAAEDDVGAAAGHVGGDGHGVLAAGLGHDFGLALVVLGVEHLVLDAPLVEHRREPLALFDRHGADQHRPAALLRRRAIFERGNRLALLVLAQLNLDRIVVLARRSCRPARCRRSVRRRPSGAAARSRRRWR